MLQKYKQQGYAEVNVNKLLQAVCFMLIPYRMSIILLVS